jgi:hypothetical protein
MPNLVVSAVAKWNGTALKKGQKDLTQFQKTTNLLAKSFAAAFAVKKIAQFGKAAVQAFAADEKAAKSLEVALRNTGNGFATIATEGFIARLQQTYKVLDDELRPAFQTLLQATGSLTESQKGLELALNVSKGTSKSVQEVSMALAKAYGGQTTALSRLGAGLDKAVLASGDMEAIMAALTARFKGQALAATKTYAGQMDALAVSSANVKEIIGKGILDSIALLGDSDGIGKATAEMEKFAQSSSDALLGVASLLDKFKSTKTGGFLTERFSAFMNSGYLASLGKEQRLKNQPYSPTSMYFTTEQAERAKLVATIKKQNLIEKEKQKLTAAELAAKKKQAELDELKKNFDVDRINLETALANSKDEAEKARIRSLLTIMDEDANSAAKRMADLDKANADKMRQEYLAAVSLNNLAEAARLAALGIKTITIGGVPIQDFQNRVTDQSGIADELLAKAAMIEAEIALKEAEDAVARSIKVAQESEAAVAALAATTGGPVNYGYTAANPSFTYGANSAPVFNISTPLGTEETITELVQKAVQKINRYGDNLSYAGAL